MSSFFERLGLQEKRTRVALGMSGGVDSAASAAILMRSGYEVVGVTCLFLDDQASQESARDAAAVCKTLGIEHVVKNYTQSFELNVVAPFVDDYSCGLTPSPCVSCNARCKLPALIAAADERACEKIATGHYGRVVQLQDTGLFAIKRALDNAKDQSYMLSQLSQDQLSRLILPLGGITKVEVRLFAQDLGLAVADKPDSQDVCFIPDQSYVGFLRERGKQGMSGAIVDQQGKTIGTHEGLECYTIGQRKGLGIGGAPAPYYVLEKRTSSNELVVGFQEQAFIKEILVGAVNWQACKDLDEPLECSCKIRYRSMAVPCVVESCGDGGVRVSFNTPQPITSPGQFAVFYLADTMLGGGEITAIMQV